jgi:outer membrane lipase/esterase
VRSAAIPAPTASTAHDPACAGTSLTCVSSGSGAAFADGVHPSSEAHAIISQYAVSVLEAPRQMALLPNSASMVGRSRAERVAAHPASPSGWHEVVERPARRLPAL